MFSKAKQSASGWWNRVSSKLSPQRRYCQGNTGQGGHLTLARRMADGHFMGSPRHHAGLHGKAARLLVLPPGEGIAGTVEQLPGSLEIPWRQVDRVGDLGGLQGLARVAHFLNRWRRGAGRQPQKSRPDGEATGETPGCFSQAHENKRDFAVETASPPACETSTGPVGCQENSR